MASVEPMGAGPTASTPYGVELILDLHSCNPDKFNRESIEGFFDQLCQKIEMQKCIVHFWDDVGVAEEDQQTLPHTKGTSAVCFILTSSIVIHTLDILKSVYVNIFSCKDFDPTTAAEFTRSWFEGDEMTSTFVARTSSPSPQL